MKKKKKEKEGGSEIIVDKSTKIKAKNCLGDSNDTKKKGLRIK